MYKIDIFVQQIGLEMLSNERVKHVLIKFGDDKKSFDLGPYFSSN